MPYGMRISRLRQKESEKTISCAAGMRTPTAPRNASEPQDEKKVEVVVDAEEEGEAGSTCAAGGGADSGKTFASNEAAGSREATVSTEAGSIGFSCLDEWN